jgi:hypothetical protein
MLVIHFIIGFIVALVLFLGGLYFYAKHNVRTSSCPNILIQYDSKYYLFNSNKARITGINPIVFKTLEDYNEFLKWQQTVGIKCPVLYVQKTYDAQGKRVFKIRSDVNELKGGLPPSTPSYVLSKPQDTEVVNKSTVCENSTDDIPGPVIDLLYRTGSDVSEHSTLEQPEQKRRDPSQTDPEFLIPCPVSTFKSFSDNPMDINWGGEDYTEKSIKAGKYAGSEIKKSHVGSDTTMELIKDATKPFTQYTHI